VPLARAFSGQERTGEHVGFYIDHDNVLAGSDRCAGHGQSRAGGLPVASTMTSTLRIGARFGSRRDKNGFAAIRGASQPTLRQALRRPLGIEIGDDRNL